MWYNTKSVVVSTRQFWHLTMELKFSGCLYKFFIGLVLFPVFSSLHCSGYVEVFRDDFNTDSIDATKWNLVDAPSNVNWEQQYYSPEENFQANGNLYLRSQKREWEGRNFTSGRVDTRGKFEMLYGEIEWRAQLPKGQGIWPALWLAPIACEAGQLGCTTWPPEIDVMESCGQHPNNITSTVHYGEPWPKNHQDTLSVFPGPDYSEDYHTYKVLWNETHVIFYVDEDAVHTVTGKDKVPDKEMYLMAVGGVFCGNPDDTTKFPTYFAIDYVSVHQWL